MSIPEGEAWPASEPEAFGWAELETVYREHAPSLCGLARGLQPDLGLADDLVQEAFLRTFESRRFVGRPPEPVRYLARTIVNLSRSQRGRARRAASFRALLAPLRPTDSQGRADTEMLDLIHRLPTGQRETLLVRYWLGLSVDDAADLLGVSSGTVKTQSHRALARLRKDSTDWS